MYRFTVHGFQSSPKEPCLWKLAAFTFGHMDLQTCQSWMDQLNYSLIKEVERPRNLLVNLFASGSSNLLVLFCMNALKGLLVTSLGIRSSKKW